MPGEKGPPQSLTEDLGASHALAAVSVLPRQDGTPDALVDLYRLEGSNDGTNGSQPREGGFSNIRANPVEQRIALPDGTKTRHIRFTALPPQASLPQPYTGKAKLILPTVRSSVSKCETLTLKIIALDSQPVKSVAVRVRPLGHDEWQTIPAKHISRAVHEAAMPTAQDDFEYHTTTLTADGKEFLWSVTAPQLNQWVVAWANDQ